MEKEQRIIVIFLIIAIIFSVSSIVISLSLNNFGFMKIGNLSGKGLKGSGDVQIIVEENPDFAVGDSP